MSHRTRLPFHGGLLLFATTSLSAVAAEPFACEEAEKLHECEERAQILAKEKLDIPAFKNDVLKAGSNLISEVHERLLNLPIGATVGQALSTTTSLLPNFNLAGLPASGKDGGAIKGDWNLGLPGAEANNSQLRLLAAPEPTLAQPVIDAVNAAGSSVDALKQRLDVTDDLSAQFTWSLTGHGFGRNLDQYRDGLSSLLLRTLLSSELAKSDNALLNSFPEDCVGGAPSDTQIKKIKAHILALPTEKRASCDALLEAVLAEMEQVGQKYGERLQSFATARQSAGLDRYADLVSNQPQLTVSVKHSERAPLVGASLTAVRVSYETGWVNLNSFLRHDGEPCLGHNKFGWGQAVGDATASETCLTAYSNYVSRKAKALETQDRLSAWLEYAHLDDINLTQAVDGVDLAIEGGDRYTAGLGYGRVLWQEGDDKPMSTRIDASGRFERYQNDDSRQDRLVYSVVLTQKVGVLNIPLVLAYADKSEYKGSEEDGLLANLGLSYDFGLPEAPALAQTALERVTQVIPVLSGN